MSILARVDIAQNVAVVSLNILDTKTLEGTAEITTSMRSFMGQFRDLLLALNGFTICILNLPCTLRNQHRIDFVNFL